MKLYLIRHAPVLGKTGFIYGDEAEVNLTGQEVTILSLSAALPAPDIADWYSSGVDRARKTSEAVLQHLSTSRAIPFSICTHGGFREQDFGDLTGKAHEDVLAHVQFVQGKVFSPQPPNGEGIISLISRVSKSIQEVRESAERKSKRNIVVFCHGGTIRAAHIVIKQLNVADYITLDTPPFSVHQYDI